MEYRELEAILAELHLVRPEGIGAFRSRLRILRDVGVPSVTKPGKGARVTYQFQDLWQAHLGLHLEHFGLSPLSVKFVTEERERWLAEMREWEKKTTKDIWGYMKFFRFQNSSPDDDRRTWVGIYPLDDAFLDIKQTEIEKDRAMLTGLINLSQLTRECEAVMAKHVK